MSEIRNTAFRIFCKREQKRILEIKILTKTDVEQKDWKMNQGNISESRIIKKWKNIIKRVRKLEFNNCLKRG